MIAVAMKTAGVEWNAELNKRLKEEHKVLADGIATAVKMETDKTEDKIQANTDTIAVGMEKSETLKKSMEKKDEQIREIVNQVTQMVSTEFEELKNKVKRLEQDNRFDDLKNQMKNWEENKETSKDKDKDKEKRVMTSRRDFSYLPKYSGKHEEYEDWKFKVKTFLGEENKIQRTIYGVGKEKRAAERR